MVRRIRSYKIAHVVDKTTLAIKEFELPHKDSRPRRIAITPDDMRRAVAAMDGALDELGIRTRRAA